MAVGLILPNRSIFGPLCSGPKVALRPGINRQRYIITATHRSVRPLCAQYRVSRIRLITPDEQKIIWGLKCTSGKLWANTGFLTNFTKKNLEKLGLNFK